MAKNYRRTQTKHRKAKKGHGWTELERIKMGCNWVALRNVGPTFLQVYRSIYQNAIYTAGRLCGVILQMKYSGSANLTFRTHS